MQTFGEYAKLTADEAEAIRVMDRSEAWYMVEVAYDGTEEDRLCLVRKFIGVSQYCDCIGDTESSRLFSLWATTTQLGRPGANRLPPL